MRILIVDDNDLIRNGIATILSSEQGFAICGEAKDGMEALEKIPDLTPDLVLFDISMPGITGLETARLILKDFPKIKVLMLTQNDTAYFLPCILALGGQGCVDKSRTYLDLLPSIKALWEPAKAAAQANSASRAGSILLPH